MTDDAMRRAVHTVDRLRAHRDELEAENGRLRARVAELEAGLHQDAWDRGYVAGQSSGATAERAAIVADLRAVHGPGNGHRVACYALADRYERGDHVR